MRLLATISIVGLAAFAATPKTYQLTSPGDWTPVHSEHLQMGGSAPDGGTIGVNNSYIVRDGQPRIMVCGEFHYSRYPAEQWEQEIIKMKAGGINVLPSYVFWSLHEPEEGRFKWDGNLDLRKFIEICRKHDMDVIVRVGPFGHGEIRNGGIPDWIFAKNLDIRCNHPAYLECVTEFYNEIGRQLEGLYYKDGGPVIGCQIENEHQHAAAPHAVEYKGERVSDITAASYDKDHPGTLPNQEAYKASLGEQHMQTLLEIAQQAGIITPIYTATGWGNAAVIPGKTIPVTAAYTYPTWTRKQKMSEFCMFKDLRLNPDYSPVRYNTDDYPSAAAEMGVGIQMVYDKRPICTGEAAEALVVRTLGSGSNIIGYYMYHGGSTPTATGNGLTQFFSDQPTGVPKISYDFQAPLGEFGLEAPSYRPLRVIHHFVNEFGNILAPMQTVLPADISAMTPGNREDLRYAARMNPNGGGFLFLVNAQDHDPGRRDQTNLRVSLNLPDEKITIGGEKGFTLPKNSSAILPFNLDLNGILLKWATAQPIMKIDDNGTPHYFFFVHEGMQPEYVFENGLRKAVLPGLSSTFSVKHNGRKLKITTLSYAQALNAVKVNEKIIISEATVVPEGDNVKLLSLGNNEISYVMYPSKDGFKSKAITVAAVNPVLAVDRSVAQRMEITFADAAGDAPQVNEYFLSVPYTGDLAMAYLDNEMILDHFWQGKPWLIGLNRFSGKMADGRPMGFYFRPLRKDAPFLADLPEDVIPNLDHGPVLEIGVPVVIPEYSAIITTK